MSGKLDLRVRNAVTVDVPVLATVAISGARPAGLVTVELTGTRGPSWRAVPRAQVTHADDEGGGAVVFEVTFAGSGTAVLLATGIDKDGMGLDPDAEMVQVAP